MAKPEHARVWYREPWPWILMAGPGVVILAGIVTVWLSVVSNDGLVTDDYYKQGLAINQRLQRDHHASSIGLQGDLMRAGKGVRLLLSATGEAEYPEQLKLKLLHPTRSGQDLLVEMRLEGHGMYSGQLPDLPGGRWHVMLEDPAGVWRLQGDWLMDRDQQVRLGTHKES